MDNFTIGLRFGGGAVGFAAGGGGVNPCMFPACQQLLQSWMPGPGNFGLPGYMQAPPFFMPPPPNMGGFPQPDPGWGSPFPFCNPFQDMGQMPYQPPCNPGFGGYQPSIPNNGALYRYPEYAQIQQRARENGTLDGTPVTPQSSFPEDQFHTDALARLNQRAAARVMDEARAASPREFGALQRNEGELQQYLQQQSEQGRGFSGAEINRLRSQGIETLYQDGQVGQGVGQANREFMELQEAWERSEANQQLKYGIGPQPGLSERAYRESPFNPQREATHHAAQPQPKPKPQPQLSQQQVPQHKPPTAEQLKEVRRLDPPPGEKPAARPVQAEAAKTTDKPAARPAQAEAAKTPDKPAPKPYDANKDSNELYKSMHGGLTGWGTDEGALFKALEGKSKDQIDKIKANYKDHYGKDLDKDLESELSGKDYSRAQALLKGNQSAADATAIQQAVGTLWNDDKAIQQTLAGKTGEERKAIAEEFKKQTGKELKTELTKEMSGADRDQALANLEGNNAKSDAAKLQKAMKGMGTDESAIMSTLQGKNADERAAIMKSYKETYGVDLKERLKDDLGGSELDQANALLAGDNAKAAAAQIKTAASGLGTDEKSLNEALQGKTAEERKAITEAYQQTYHTDLRSELKDELSGNDLQKSEALLDRGKLSDAEQLKFALEGAGTDEEAVKAALQGKSKEEIARLRQDYSKLTNRELDADIAGDMSGREHFDAQQSLKGRAETVDKAVERANEVHAYERGGEGNSFSRGFVDMFSDKGELLDKNTDRVNESKGKFDQLVAEGRLDEARVEKKRLQELTGFATADVETYREAKDSAADTAGTIAATAAGVAVVVATAGTATPLVATVAMAAGAGATARVVTSGMIQGEGYGVESALSDAGRGAIDGGTAIIGMGAGKAATTAGKAAAEEVATQTVTRKVLQAGAQGVKDGALGGAVGAGASEAIHDGTWDDGLVNGLGRVATTTAVGAATGAVAGGAVSGGIIAGKEAAVGLNNAAREAATSLRAAGQDAAQGLRTMGQDLRTTGQQAAEQLRSAADDAGARLKTMGQDAGQRLRSAADDLRTTTQDAGQRLRTAAEDLKTTTQDAVAEFKATRSTPEVKAETAPPEVKAEVKAETAPPEVKAEVKAETAPPEVKAEVKAETPPEVKGELKGTAGPAEKGGAKPPPLPENAGLDGPDATYKGIGEWSDGPIEKGFQTRVRKVTDANGDEWTQVVGKNGPHQERLVKATDNGPDWKEVDNGWGVTTKSRKIKAEDGGPEWNETEQGGNLSRQRQVPDADGKGDWSEISNDTGSYKSRQYKDDQGNWVEAIQGGNRWRTREGGAWGLQNEARKMGQHKLTVPGVGGAPMEVQVFGKATPDQLRFIEDALKDIPEGARAWGKEIYLNENLGEILDASGKKVGGIGGLGGDGKVLLSASDVTNPHSMREILYHEMGHNADYGQGRLSSKGTVWGGKSVSEYGSLNAAEDFAEVHGSVMQNWDAYSNRTAAQWKQDPFAAKKLEILKMYGANPPSLEDIANVKAPSTWKRWLGLEPSAAPPGNGIGGMLGGQSLSFDQWFGAIDRSALAKQLGFDGANLDSQALKDAAKKYLLSMTGR